MRSAELKGEVVRRATPTLTLRIPHSPVRTGGEGKSDRPALPCGEAVGVRADLGPDRPLRRQDPAHRARTRPVAAIPQQEGRIDLRAHGGDHSPYPAGRYADRTAHVAGGGVPP